MGGILTAGCFSLLGRGARSGISRGSRQPYLSARTGRQSLTATTDDHRTRKELYLTCMLSMSSIPQSMKSVLTLKETACTMGVPSLAGYAVPILAHD
jgi:hypothetical protein